MIFELATANSIGKREDALFPGPPGSGKNHCAQAIGHAIIQQNYRVLYLEARTLLEELADSPTVSAMRDHLLHHAHVLKCGQRDWRTKTSDPTRGK